MNFIFPKILLLLLVIFAISTVVKADESDESNLLLNNLRKMRNKQQGEEQVIRTRQFINYTETKYQCTPAQQVRQRIRNIEGGSDEDETQQNVTINAGHENLDITDNHGTINSDVNIQVVNNGENMECL